MPYTRETIPADHTEFGGGPGLIDPVMRKDRNVTAAQQMVELYASNPMDPTTELEDTDINYIPRPKPYEWPDKKTAKGTTEA